MAWRTILRVLSSGIFGWLGFWFARHMIMITLGQPGVAEASNFGEATIYWASTAVGIFVFAGLLLRDIASGIGREK